MKFCWHIISLQFVNISVTCFDISLELSHTLWISSIIRNDKSVYVAQVEHILNFPYDSWKLNLIDSINWPGITRWLFYYFVARKARLMTLEVLNLIYLIHKASFKEEGLNKVAFTTVLSENMLGPWSTQGSNLNILILQLGTVLTNTTQARHSFKGRSTRSHSP